MKKKTNRLIFLIFLGTVALSSADYSYADEETDEGIPEIYLIKKGDTLWDITEKYFNNPFQWPDIWKNNDYIINPDLIYPGNKLLLRKLLQEALPHKEEKKEVKIKRKVTKPGKRRIAKPAKPAVAEKTPVTNTSVFRKAGFVEREDFRVGTIIGSPLSRITLSKGDNVYTDIGPSKNVTLEKKYSIYRTLKEIKHPVTQEDMGFLYNIVGTLIIKKFKEDRSVALITDSYEEIARNDLITDYFELEIPMIDPSLQPPKKNIQGYIISAKDERRSVGLRDIVYLDVGKSQGVAPGDRFIAYKSQVETTGTSSEKAIFQYPKITIGELKIISTRDETATALVTKSNQELDVGEKVEYKLPRK